MSLVLRHKPEVINIELSEEGWVDTSLLLQNMNAHGKKIDFDTLCDIVDQNDKQRFRFNGDKTQIRANQGHSIKIELGYSPVIPPEILYHGTATRFLSSIMEQGILKGNRHHVHLSASEETAVSVGQRHGKVVVLKVKAKEMMETGYLFYESDNHVWLTDHIPAEFLSE